VTLLFFAGAFALATFWSQRLLGHAKVQTRAEAVAVLQLAVALPAVAAGDAWLASGWLGPALFWLGAGLAWFVVRSHIESSILLAMLEDVAAGRSDRDELAKRHAALGFAERMRGLHDAGLIQDGADPQSLTRKGSVVLSGFRLFGGSPRERSARAISTPC
jgi:hypothetical protein